ncbi:MAG TPA: acyclic terpene utilization AtuA family protein [Nocardioidaceae bacterium]|nr:acyclic terpene utilization AtuA family protein [Nocardioidaceae bacterium]
MTLRIANCSGFYGDRLTAMREMIEAGQESAQVDVVTGDYLAELTMLILGKDQLKDPSLGYARTFVKQVEDCIELALEKGVKIVSNAGGLNPAGLAEKLQDLGAKVAYVDGDNLVARADELGLGKPLTANAYLGAFGIASALQHGADIVVTGRVTDASVVVGPAIAHYGWSRDDFDALAGAVVAGHVIECGTQATGGNFSGFRALWGKGLDLRPLGFPIAEVEADGSCVITKHEGTGGAVTVDTVTAQLVYEVQSTRYFGPDVTTQLDTISLDQVGPDRVRISDVRGEAPPAETKVCVNVLGGFRNQAELVLTGLDIDAKADWFRMQLEAAFEGNRPEFVDWALARTDHEDASTEEAASARLRVVVRDPSPDRVGKGFTAPLVELALGSYPGFTMTTPPMPGTPYGVYQPYYVAQDTVPHVVHHHDGTVESVDPPPTTGGRAATGALAEAASVETLEGDVTSLVSTDARQLAARPPGVTRRAPLGTFVHARSGDKGGDANIGLWVSEGRADRAEWLLSTITPDVVRALVPEAEDLEIEVFALPNLRAVNVLIRGILGEGVAASSRFDPQAKGLGEWVRSRYIEIPEELLS